VSPPLVAVPMRIERLALGHGLHVGWGPRRWDSAVARLRAALDSGVYSGLLIVGVCGALDSGLAAGDLVVASELRGPGGTVACAGSEPMVDRLLTVGRAVHLGPILTTDHLVDRSERDALAAAGALAVDTESAVFAAAAGDLPVLAVRAVSDGPDSPLWSPRIVRNGLSALRSLRAAAPALAGWSPIEREVG
jgi:4-hydroxy-3-methylbut-2-enyl diphosphate reductase